MKHSLALLAALFACGASLQAATPAKLPIVGLVTMGRVGDLHRGLAPDNSLKEAHAHSAIYAGAVILATWARLEPDRGRFDFSDIEQGLAAVRAYNSAYPTRPLAGKLRVFAGSSAPAWVKRLAGGPVGVNKKGKERVDIPKFWTVEYQQAWRELQQALADRYDGEPLMREVAISSCAALTAEPFIMPIHGAVSLRALQTAGYSDAAIRARLMEALDDYAPWKQTVLDYTFNPFWNTDTGTAVPDPEFVASVMRAFRQRYGARAVIAHHGLIDPLRDGAQAIYDQMLALGPPLEFQTFSPTQDFQAAIRLGLKYRPTEIELWDSREAGGLAPLSAEMLKDWDAGLQRAQQQSRPK